jgi:outer membrane protein
MKIRPKIALILISIAFSMASLTPCAIPSESLPVCGKVCAEDEPGCGVCSAEVKVPTSVSSRTEMYVPAMVSRPLSLADCYRLSLKQSEVIAINADMIKIADARFLQALSIMLPHFSFISNDMQEEQGPPPITGSASTTSEFQSLDPTRSSDRRFNVKQTLFKGFKAFAAIKGSKFDKNQRIEQKIRAEQLLLVDVANAFYLLIEKREDIRALKRIESALYRRVKELRERERLGRSRPSEIVNAKAQFYAVQSNIEVVRNQATLARQLLEFLIGQPVRDVVDSYEIPTKLQPKEYYLVKSERRPDVLAAKYAALVAKQEYRMVDSDFLPTAVLEADSYTQRTGFSKGVDWDVMLRVDVPIFDGGYTLGRSKEYSLKADQADLEFRRVRRRAPFDIKDAYANLYTAISVQESLRKAYTTAKLNYYLQRKDYERSLVSNLDTLASIQTLQDAQRNYIRALYEAKRLYWRLRVAVGEGMEETLSDTF